MKFSVVILEPEIPEELIGVAISISCEGGVILDMSKDNNELTVFKGDG